MDEVEIKPGMATNKTTRASVWLDLVPREMAAVDYWYENPRFNVKVGFPAKKIYEETQIGPDGQPRTVRCEIGIIVEENALKKRIEKSLRENATDELINTLVLDCYRLLAALYTKRYLSGRTDMQFHLYEAEANTYRKLRFEIPASVAGSVQLKQVI
jgi:hypothetical protein